MPLDDPQMPSRAPVGSRALTGGAIATVIGILLLVLGPAPTPGVPLNPHQMAWVILGMGLFLLLIGVLARLFFSD